ncbi:MAG: aminoglycoside phosphotransferase family protein [bacterium]|nr:aminoglycoside phosphotransferase family protein [bacterium]
MTWSAPRHDTNTELRDHLSPDAWSEAIVEIARVHELDTSGLHAFPTGSDVVWGAGAWVVKMTAPLWQDEIEAEARLLETVAGKLSVATPRALATGTLDGWPYVLMSLVAGIPIGNAWAETDATDHVRLATDLGRLTAELHALQVPAGDDDWDAFWARCRQDVGKRHARQADLPAALVDAIDPFLARAGDLSQSPRVLLHTELLDQHILVTERDGKHELAALIDFADGRVGPAGYEFPALVEFLFKGEPGVLRAFLGAYGVPASELTEERQHEMLAWGLSHRFGSLARMLAAAGEPTPSTLEDLGARLYGFR